MFKRIAGGALLLSLLVLGQPLRVHADAAPSVVINEVMWMGSTASSADEWLELKNLSAVPVDVSGWQLTRRSSGVEVLMLVVPSGKSIPASGYFLIANNVPTALFGTAPNQKESPLAAVPDLVDTSVSLLNTGLQLKLYAGAWNAGGALVDTADDGSGNPLAGGFDSAAGTYASMERNAVPGDGTSAASWHTSTRGEGWDAGAVERGTPGTANSASTPIAVLAAPGAGTVGQPLTFDASESTDPEGRVLAYAWAFGDGGSADGVAVNHTFAAVGNFSVQVTVSNGERTATASGSVSVSEAVATTTPEPPLPVGDVVLSELQPTPSDGEFVEVWNRGTTEANLGGWIVADSARRFTLPSATLAAGARKAYPTATTGIHFNDDGDTAYLYAPDGSLRDAVRYTTSRSGWSLIRSGDTWAWTDHPTVGSANVPLGAVADATITEAPELPEAGAVRGASTAATTGAALRTVALDGIGGFERNAVVRVHGTVTALPGTVAARTVYITDGTNGLAVYAATAALPTLSLGDRIEATGRVSHVQRGDRLLVSRTSDIRVLGHGAAPPPRTLSVSELDAETVGSLVTVSAPLVDLTASRLTLDDGSGEIVVRRPKGFRGKPGDVVTTTGIVIGGDALVVYPRSLEDVPVSTATVAGAESSNPFLPTAKAAAPGSALQVDAPKGDSTGAALLLFGGVVTLGALTLVLLKRFAPHLWDRRRSS